jgi:Ca2+-binding EF-hand superfamily protein
MFIWIYVARSILQDMRTGEYNKSVFSKTKIQEILQSIDSDGNGILDYQEFLASVIHTLDLEQDHSFEKSAQQAFSSLDTDGNGFLSISEIMTKLSSVDRSSVEEMISEVDENGDGLIDFAEFTQVLKDRGVRGSVDGGRPLHLLGAQPLSPCRVSFASLPAHKQINLSALGPVMNKSSSSRQSQRLDSLPLVPGTDSPGWAGVVIIKALLKQAEEIKKEIKVKRKQMELERQQKAARAKVQNTLRNARLSPMGSMIDKASVKKANAQLLGESASRGKPAPALEYIEPVTDDRVIDLMSSANAFDLLAAPKMQFVAAANKPRLSVSRVPIFSHPIELDM